MSWFSRRRDDWDDEYPADRGLGDNRDEDYYLSREQGLFPPRNNPRSWTPWWASALRNVSNGRGGGGLIGAAVAISWLIALTVEGELTRILALLGASAVTASGTWWLYYRLNLNWADTGIGVSAEAVESGLGQDLTREQKMRTARKSAYTLAIVTVACAVLGAATTGTTSTSTPQGALPPDVVALDSSIRASASGNDEESVRKAWMLAGARPAVSGVNVTGVLGSRVWLEVATSDTPSTVCLEIADASTPAKRTTCAGLGASAARGPRPPMAQQQAPALQAP